MKKLYAVDLLNSTVSGELVELYGWVKARRRHNHVVFLDVSDSTGSIQVVADETQELFGMARRITPESAIKVTGILTDTGRANPTKEIRANHIEIVGFVTIDVSPRPRSNINIFDPKH